METNQTNGNNFEDRIIKDIERSGYPTEIQSASKMIDDGWVVSHNPSFLDKDEGTSREFDIEAIKTLKTKVGQSSFAQARTPEQVIQFQQGIFFYTNVRLICECKKSVNRPWVFFITKEMNKSSISLNENIHKSFLINSNDIKEKFGDRDDDYIFNQGEIRSAHHYLENNYFARTYFEAFKGNDKDSKSNEKPQQIYDAVMSCIKATLYLEDSRKPNHLFLNYPIIIFKGNLFTSSIEDNKIKVNKTNHVQLAFNYITTNKNNITPSSNEGRFIIPFFHSPLGNRHKFIIDIVNFDYLEDFLKLINKEFSLINTLIEGILE